jgi:hypothetical protein
MTAALTCMDDSSGALGADLDAVMRLYARACAAAPPNPTALAGWLVKVAYDGPGWPEVRLGEFAPALGGRGLAALAALVEERAAGADPDSWGRAFATRDLREQLAEVAGDVDRHVAVLAEHLGHAGRFLRIVRVLADAGRPAEAVGWARRGLAEADAGGPDVDRLRDALVDLLIDADEPWAAVAERRAAFERHPGAAGYRALLETARRCGGGDGLGGWAVEVLHARVARRPALAAELVAVLLAEGRAEEAWRVGCDHAGGLSEQRFVELLETRRAGHPADVLGPYRALVERHVLDAADKRRYQKAVALLPRLRAAYLDAGDADGFAAYLEELRAEHRRRPAFISRLDAAGL